MFSPSFSLQDTMLSKFLFPTVQAGYSVKQTWVSKSNWYWYSSAWGILLYCRKLGEKVPIFRRKLRGLHLQVWEDNRMIKQSTITAIKKVHNGLPSVAFVIFVYYYAE